MLFNLIFRNLIPTSRELKRENEALKRRSDHRERFALQVLFPRFSSHTDVVFLPAR